MPSGHSRSGAVGKRAQRRRAPVAEPHARDSSTAATEHPLLELQHAVGNAVVARLIAQRQGGGGGAAIAPKVSGSPFPQRTKQFFSNGQVIGAVASATGASLVIGTSDKGGLGFPAGTQEVTFDKPGVTSSDKKGAIRFFVDMAWEFANSDPTTDVHGRVPVIPLHKVDNPLGATSKGTAAVKVDVPYVINTGVDKDAGKDKDTQTTESKSELKFLKERFVQQESSGTGAQLVMPVPVGADPTQDGGTATISPGLTFQEQIAFQAGAQSTTGLPKIPIPGINDLQPDLSVAKGEQVQSQESKTQSYAESYAASVKLVPPAAAATETFKHTVFFNVDSDQVLEGEEDPELSTWCTNDDATVTQTPRGDKVLPASVLAAIAQGKATVILTGKASVTGPKGKKGSYNRKLSHRRAENVQKILSDLLGSTVKFRSFAIGKYKAKEKVKEAKEERVVEIEVTGEVASAAPAAAGAGQ